MLSHDFSSMFAQTEAFMLFGNFYVKRKSHTAMQNVRYAPVRTYQTNSYRSMLCIFCLHPLNPIPRAPIAVRLFLNFCTMIPAALPALAKTPDTRALPLASTKSLRFYIQLLRLCQPPITTSIFLRKSFTAPAISSSSLSRACPAAMPYL